VPCRRAARQSKRLRQEYDRLVAEALQGQNKELKARVVEIIDLLDEGRSKLPAKVYENRDLLLRQLAK
jgi:hypothetical protein